MLDPGSGNAVELKRTLDRLRETIPCFGGLRNGREIDSSPNLRMNSMSVESRSCDRDKDGCKECKHLIAISPLQLQLNFFFSFLLALSTRLVFL